MTSILRHKALLQLGLCLLLITGFTLWSVSWHSPAFQEGEFKQLGDSSPSFLISVGDSSIVPIRPAERSPGPHRAGWLKMRH